MDTQQEIARLRWQCRRGMLELDLLLERFIDYGYSQLTAPERAVFREVLNYADQDLFEYFFGHRLPDNKDVAHVIERIRLTSAA